MDEAAEQLERFPLNATCPICNRLFSQTSRVAFNAPEQTCSWVCARLDGYVPDANAVPQRGATVRDLPKLLREAERRVNAHVWPRPGADDHLASIPANADTDTDMLLMEAADRITELDAALREVRRCGQHLPVREIIDKALGDTWEQETGCGPDGITIRDEGKR